jgi:hypothetical protein
MGDRKCGEHDNFTDLGQEPKNGIFEYYNDRGGRAFRVLASEDGGKTWTKAAQNYGGEDFNVCTFKENIEMAKTQGYTDFDERSNKPDLNSFSG